MGCGIFYSVIRRLWSENTHHKRNISVQLVCIQFNWIGFDVVICVL